jgi:phytoene synthase
VVSALVTGGRDGLSAAYAYCDALARRHYENFPVASRLLPASMRPHIAAIYAFARTADDFADEPGLDDAERLRRLDDWGDRLRRASGDPGVGGGNLDGPQERENQIFIALANTMRQKSLPAGLFDDLLSAFRQDVTTKRYATWTDVLDYCRRSANPVGRLVLLVAGGRDETAARRSDAVCTALQLTNFWQDLAIDWQRGRLYVPLEDRDRAAASDADLQANRMSPEWRTALGVVAHRTQELFDAGRPVCDAVSGRLRWELRLTWLGGTRVLQKLRTVDFDVFNRRPTLDRSDVPSLLWRALRWKPGSGVREAGSDTRGTDN